MKFYLKLKYFFLIIGLLTSFTKLDAQEYEPSERDTTSQSAFIPHKGFHAGLFVGAFWAINIRPIYMTAMDLIRTDKEIHLITVFFTIKL